MSEDRVPGQRERQAEFGIPMELPDCVKEPCNECPWRRESAAGWLGPHPPEDWIMMAHGETPIMCHKTVTEDENFEGTKQCRGAAMFRAHIAKSPRRADMPTGPVDKEKVFATNDEFMEHHTKNAEVNGWHNGDEIKMLVDKDYVEEGEKGTLRIVPTGSPLFMNYELKLYFLPDGADETIQEIDIYEFEEVQV